MERVGLTFSVLYHILVKDNTPYPQYDSVNMLLYGIFRDSNLTGKYVDDSACSNYVKGKKPIRTEIIRSFYLCDEDEIIRRFNNLAFQNAENTARITKSILSKILDMNTNTIKELVNSLDQIEPARYFARLFFYAMRSNTNTQMTAQMRSYIDMLKTLPLDEDNVTPTEDSKNKITLTNDIVETNTSAKKPTETAPFPQNSNGVPPKSEQFDQVQSDSSSEGEIRIYYHDVHLTLDNDDEFERLKNEAIEMVSSSKQSVKGKMVKLFAESPLGAHIIQQDLCGTIDSVLAYLKSIYQSIINDTSTIIIDLRNKSPYEQFFKISNLFRKFIPKESYDYREFDTFAENECIVHVFSLVNATD